MRNCKLLILFLLLTLCANEAVGQTSFGGGMVVTTKKSKANSGNKDESNQEARLVKYSGKSDINGSVKPRLYRSVRKVFGRYVGVGEPVDAKERSHYKVLYRLSEQNMAGSWTKMEALNFRGKFTTEHSLGTYILNQYDEKDAAANEKWVEKLKSVCQWSIIYDATGETVVQERAYDADGNLIYTYSPMKISKNEVTGAYTDCWGMPVNMRGKSGSTMVKIKWDEKGNEVEYVFVDEKGRPMKNQSGSFMSRFEYDEAGNQTKNVSCDEFGGPIMDDYGNCGWVAEYDRWHNQKCVKYVNERMELMEMPASERNGGSETQGVAIVNFEYDKWHRMTNEWFCDVNGKPDTNAFGFHRVVMEYDDNGNLTWLRYYGTDGRICGNSYYNGAGMSHRVYDRWGVLCMVEFFGSDTTVRVNGGADEGWCKWVSHNVNEEGVYDVYREYRIVDGEMVCRYSYEKEGNRCVQVFDDGTFRIDSFDVTGYQISEMHFDSDNKPYEPDGYHKKVSSKRKIGENVTLEQIRWFGADGKPINYKRRAMQEMEVDSLNRTVRLRKDNAKGVMVDHFMTQRDEKWNIVGQWALNGFGVQARTMRSGGYYAIETKLSFEDGISDVYYRNEFGELAYDHDVRTIGCHRRQMGDSTVYYDEDGEVVRDFDKLRSSLPIAYVVEVTDSVGYRNGLRDGDVILQYGEWHYELAPKGDVKVIFWGDAYAAFVAEADRSKVVRVLRHDKERRRSDVVTLNLGKGRIDELGFNAHYIYYTRREYERLQSAMSGFVSDNGLTAEWDNKKSKAVYACVVPECMNYVSAQLFYGRRMSAPVMILAAERYLEGEDMSAAPSPGNQWIMGESKELMDGIIWNKDKAAVAKHVYYVTCDGVSIDTVVFGFDGMKYARKGCVANEKVCMVGYDERFNKNMNGLLRSLLGGGCGFRRSESFQFLQYVALDDLFGMDEFAGMNALVLKDGKTYFDAFLLKAELRKSVVDSVTILNTKGKGIRLLRRVKSDAVGEVVDGCILYKCMSGKRLTRVLMVRLDGGYSIMMDCDMDVAEFDAKRFVNAFNDAFGAPKENAVVMVTVDEGEREYVLMEFNGWNMYESTNELVTATRIAGGGLKRYVIARVKRDKRGDVVKIGKPEVRDEDGAKGWHFGADQSMGWVKAAAVYEEWKKEH